MAVNKHRASKGISKFLTRLFWHFEQQPVPNYSQISRDRSHSAPPTPKKMVKQSVGRSMIITTTVDRNHLGPLNPPRQRHSSFREQAVTLDAITEE